jgi:ABC-type multidrug transport system fused ATPase/permease subunit
MWPYWKVSSLDALRSSYSFAYSGKSSLIMLLLRLLDPIESDAQGLSIDDLPLHLVNRTALRSRIIALPQDAFFLPEGNTVRANLDPYGLTSTAECEAAVRDVGLWSALATGKDGLDAKVDPQSLSQGQRQLFSLGRAILRARAKAKIAPSAGGLLLMDEVSSNVDIHTDKVMQEIIRREFRAYTVIAIAHRLETIMDFDRVLIMDAGEIVKSGPPLEVFKEVDVSRAFD